MKEKSDAPNRRDEFKRHKQDIEEIYKRKIAALYELYPEYAPVSSGNGTVEHKGGYGKLSLYVKQTLEKHHEPFTLQDMQKWIVEVDPAFGAVTSRTSIYNALARLIGKGKVEKLTDGGYKKKNVPALNQVKEGK